MQIRIQQKKIMRLETRRQQTILPHEEMIKIMLSA